MAWFKKHAVSIGPLYGRFSWMFSWSRSPVSPWSMVECLLDLKADPNFNTQHDQNSAFMNNGERSQPTTPWKIALSLIASSTQPAGETFSEDMRDRWRHLAELMISHGADLDNSYAWDVLNKLPNCLEIQKKAQGTERNRARRWFSWTLDAAIGKV